MTLIIVQKKMKSVHFILPILSDIFCRWRNNFSLNMGLHHTAHPLSNVSPSWKVVFSLYQRFREIHFHRLELHNYLHQNYLLERLPYYLSIETEGSLTLWYYMSHSKWFDILWHHHEYTKEQEIGMPQQIRLLFFTKIENNNLYIYRGSLQDF